MDVQQCVAAQWVFDQVFIVAAFRINYTMEIVGLATLAIMFCFHIATRVVGFAVTCDIASLLQKVIVGSSNGAIGTCKCCCSIETEGRDGEVFVDVGDVVHVLVPDLAGIPPWLGRRLVDFQHGVGLHIASRLACNDYFSTTVIVDIGHNRHVHNGNLATIDA